MKMLPIQVQKMQIDVVNGFSYSFSMALLKKLKALKEKDRIFKDDKLRGSNKFKTDIAKIITGYLSEQMLLSEHSSSSCDIDEIEKLISVTEEFLAIFEKNNQE